MGVVRPREVLKRFGFIIRYCLVLGAPCVSGEGACRFCLEEQLFVGHIGQIHLCLMPNTDGRAPYGSSFPFRMLDLTINTALEPGLEDLSAMRLRF